LPLNSTLGRCSDQVATLKKQSGTTLEDYLQITFMRVKDGRLDRDESYTSDWLGGHTGQAEVCLGCDGKIVVGVYGECGCDLRLLGLVQAE
jgi:hypothetical protein